MSDEYGLTVQCLAKPKGSLTMTDDRELVERVAGAIVAAQFAAIYARTATPSEIAFYQSSFQREASAAIAAVRVYDAEQRSKVPTHDPDSDRECPSSLVSPPRPTGGLTEFKRD